MLKNAKRIAKAMARALVDLLSLAALLPALAFTFTVYKITLLILLYLLKDISHQQISCIIDSIKKIVGQFRAEGWDGLKARLFAALDMIKDTAIELRAKFSSWVILQITRLKNNLGPDASIAKNILCLNA